MEPIITDRLLSYKEAEEITGIKVQTWRLWEKERTFPVVRLGRRVKIRASDLSEFIKAKTILADRIDYNAVCPSCRRRYKKQNLTNVTARDMSVRD